ncbi:hypothetical protein SS50377_24331 [Spironucleus salmonicida]|uniref:Uncharacterized protein n=1 Tax=Spironucleus salmonicida TaxID=348837 RepID=V6LN46_9EUKA|nr:hypothetical protein SS50377_24331 [Spironucleus salmonicida]|eukprot:EST46117.1 Hypothetical protein SS50377_14111 [Spironucleus salmonicida]
MQLSVSSIGKTMISNAMCLSSMIQTTQEHIQSVYEENEDSDVVQLESNQQEIMSVLKELKSILNQPSPQEIEQTIVQKQLSERQSNLNIKEKLLIEFQRDIEEQHQNQQNEKQTISEVLTRQQQIIDEVQNQIIDADLPQDLDFSLHKSVMNMSRLAPQEIVFPELQQITAMLSYYTQPQMEFLNTTVQDFQVEQFIQSDEFKLLIDFESERDIKLHLFDAWSFKFEQRVKKLLQMHFCIKTSHKKVTPLKMYASDFSDDLETTWLMCLVFLFISGNDIGLHGLQLTGLEPVMMSEM